MMMKRRILASFTALVLFAGGCSSPADQAEDTAQNFFAHRQFTTAAQLTFDGFSAQVQISRDTPQASQVTFLSPQSLEGFAYTFSQEGIALSYQGLEVTMESDALPVAAAPRLAISALESATLPGNVTVTRQQGEIHLDGVTEGGAFTLILEAQEGIPIKLLIPREDLEITFENFQYLY